MSINDRAAELLSAIPVFVQVAESRSFTAAARKLGMTASGVSKSVARLEARLGVQLAKRTTRNVSLTQEGAAYAERCRQILGELEAASAVVAPAQSHLTGKLRVQLPAAEGRKLIIPALPMFMDRHPGLALEIEFSGRASEVTDETVDVAVRIGPLPDARVAARKLCQLSYVLCASPGYLTAHGEPSEPAALAMHRCLVYVGPLTGRAVEWRLVREGVAQVAPVKTALSANAAQGLIDAAVAGGGIVLAATVLVAPLLADGRLRHVLPGWEVPSQPMNAVYLPNRYLMPKVRAFVDFLVELIPTGTD